MRPRGLTHRWPLTLADELYFLAHHDDTGRPHLHPDRLAVGLAAAVLIDCYLAGQVTLTNGTDSLHGPQIRLTTPHPQPHQPPQPGPRPSQPRDGLTGRALYLATVTPEVKPWLRAYAPGLTDQVRDRLVTLGALRTTVRPRLGGLLRTGTYLPTHVRWPVISRAQVRYLATGQEQPTNHSAALAGLVTALRLESHLYLGLPDKQLRRHLRAIVDGHHRPIRHILDAVEATNGDLATAAYH